MISRIKQWLKPEYESLNTITIDGSRILHNYHELQKIQPHANIIPVVKSNAYGHGIAEICNILQKVSPTCIAVDSYPEYQIVRDNSRSDILILSQCSPEQYKHFIYPRTHIAVTSLHVLHILREQKIPANIHLFVNTGMNREGLELEELPTAIKLARSSKVHIEGLMSHLACSDELHPLNEQQEQRFLQAHTILTEHNISPKHVHLGASTGIYTLKNPIYTTFRAGIHLYGYNQFPESHPSYKAANTLLPALSVESTVVRTQRVTPSDSVSYGATFSPKETTNIALIPFGYAEGLPRNSKDAIMTKDSQTYPVRGRICMNLSMVEHKNLLVGDKLSVISNQPELLNSVRSLAIKNNTIDYEILIRLSDRIRRNIAYSQEP